MLYEIVKKYHIKKPLFICYFIAASVILYFLFITIFGQKGLIKYYFLHQELSSKSATKEEMEKTIAKKEQLVKSMSTESLDVDLLDEQVKKNLGFGTKKEVIIYDKKND